MSILSWWEEIICLHLLLGLDWRAPRTEAPHRDLLDYGYGLSRRLGCHVHIHHLQVDVHFVALLFDHYDGLSLFDNRNAHTGHYLSLQFRKRATSIPCVFGLVNKHNLTVFSAFSVASQEPLPGDDFKPAMQQRQDDLESEKIDFPSFEPIPTYSAMFNQGFNAPVVPPTTKSNPRLGPRFRNTTLEPFETQTNRSNLVRSDSLGYTWEVASSFSTTHSNNTTQLSRQASQRSNGTGYERARPPQDTAPPYSGRHPSTEPHAYMDRQKRWVIE